MKDPLFIYVDVDDTLVEKADGQERPNTAVVHHVSELFKQGAQLYCWSTGGEDHARATAQKLGIEGCFIGFLHKPHVFIDDERAEEWPCFFHVRPDELQSFDAYQREVEKSAE
ncbi:MAG: hypothetical protein WDN28_11605 [Chthoniobacter sp.]